MDRLRRGLGFTGVAVGLLLVFFGLVVWSVSPFNSAEPNAAAALPGAAPRLAFAGGTVVPGCDAEAVGGVCGVTRLVKPAGAVKAAGAGLASPNSTRSIPFDLKLAVGANALGWVEWPGAACYQVSRGPAKAGPFSAIATVRALSYSDSAPAGQTAYTVWPVEKEADCGAPPPPKPTTGIAAVQRVLTPTVAPAATPTPVKQAVTVSEPSSPTAAPATPTRAPSPTATQTTRATPTRTATPTATAIAAPPTTGTQPAPPPPPPAPPPPGTVDKTPPVVSVPASRVVDAASAQGTLVSFIVSASDNVDGGVPVSCGWTSPARFPIGTTFVSCSARDKAGNTGTASFFVSVIDRPPVVSVPGNLSFASGEVVTFSASASDTVDGTIGVSCNPPSGVTYPNNSNTLVTCSATDSAANTVSASFNVSVGAAPPPPLDTTPPTVVVSGPSVVADSDGAPGELVSYTATATDDASGVASLSTAPQRWVSESGGIG